MRHPLLLSLLLAHAAAATAQSVRIDGNGGIQADYGGGSVAITAPAGGYGARQPDRDVVRDVRRQERQDRRDQRREYRDDRRQEWDPLRAGGAAQSAPPGFWKD